MTYLNVFPLKKICHALKQLECNLLPRLI